MRQYPPPVFTTLSYPIIEMGIPIAYGLMLIVCFVASMLVSAPEWLRLCLVIIVACAYTQGVWFTRHDDHWYRIFLNIIKNIQHPFWSLRRYKFGYWEVHYVP